MKHVTVETFKSELAEYKSEVTYTIRKVSHGLRIKIRSQLTESVKQIQKLTEDLFAIPEFAATIKEADESEGITGPQADGIKLVDEPEVEDTSDEQEKLVALTKAAYQATWIRATIEAIQKKNVDPVYLKECLVIVQGITYTKNDIPENFRDDEVEYEFDAASLLEYGPEELCLEIIDKIKLEFGITPVQELDLELGSISGAVEDGAKRDSGAATVGQGVSTKPEIAKSTTQS